MNKFKKLVLVVLAVINAFFAAAFAEAVAIFVGALTWNGKYIVQIKFVWPHLSFLSYIHFIEFFVVAFIVYKVLAFLWSKEVTYLKVLMFFVLTYLFLAFVPRYSLIALNQFQLSPDMGVRSFDFSEEVLVEDNVAKKDEVILSGNKLFWIQNVDEFLGLKSKMTNGYTRDLFYFEFDKEKGIGVTKNITNFSGDVMARDVQIVGQKVYFIRDDDEEYDEDLYVYDMDNENLELISPYVHDLYKADENRLVYYSNGGLLENDEYMDSGLYVLDLKNGRTKNLGDENFRFFGDDNVCLSDWDDEETLMKINYDDGRSEELFVFDSGSNYKILRCDDNYLMYVKDGNDFEFKDRKFQIELMDLKSGKVVFLEDWGSGQVKYKMVGEDLYYSEITFVKYGNLLKPALKKIFRYDFDQNKNEVVFKLDQGMADWDIDEGVDGDEGRDIDGENFAYIKMAEDLGSNGNGGIYMTVLER